MEDLWLIYNWKTAILFAIVILIIRPAGVFLSTYKSNLKLNEKLFISWVGPRGIVAASIASLFGITLVYKGVADAEYITPLVFMIVLGTVLLNATTARLFARITGVFLKKSNGILIVGASEVSQLIGKYLKMNDRHVVLIDSNHTNIAKAKSLGLEALTTDIYSDTLEDNIELNDIGYLMALTGSADINKYAIHKFKNHFGENGAFRLVTEDEKNDPENNPKEGLFSHTDDFALLTKTAQIYPSINEIPITDQQHYRHLIEITEKDKNRIPIFLKDSKGKLNIISSFSKEIDEIENGYILVYLGKPIDPEEINPSE
jgi:Trk K+ transport system NAD-binding subunit